MGSPDEREEWDGVTERRERHWHLKKEVTVGQIITVGSMLIGGVGYVIANERAHERHALRIDEQQRMVAKLEQGGDRAAQRLDTSVSRIESLIQRLDDKIERMMSRR